MWNMFILMFSTDHRGSTLLQIWSWWGAITPANKILFIWELSHLKALCLSPSYITSPSLLFHTMNFYFVKHPLLFGYPLLIFFFLFFKLNYSWCTVLCKLQVYNIVMHNFVGYIPVIVTTKDCLYALCCIKLVCGLFILHTIVCNPSALNLLIP